MRELLLGPMALVLVLGELRAQAPAGRLEGVVLDPLSEPVGNAAVHIEVDGEAIASTRTDAEGVFVVGRVPARAVVVRATTDTPDVGAVAVDLDPESRAFVRVRTMPARRVTGTVRDADGRAVAGAWVAFAPTGDAQLGAVGDHVRTDANGAYTLTHVPFGTNALRVHADGFAGAVLAVDGTGECRIDATLARDDVPESSFEIAHATADWRTAARLEVEAWCDGTPVWLPPELRRPALGDDGRWWLRGWPETDELRARLDLPGQCVEPPELVIERNSIRRQRQFFVEDPEDAQLRGHLVAFGGIAPGGVVLQLRPWPEGGPWREVTTDADGSFELRSPVAHARLLAIRCREPALALRSGVGSQNGLPTRTRDGVVRQHLRTTQLELEVQPACQTRARLVAADGAPLRGADVALLGVDREEGMTTDVRGIQYVCSFAAELGTGTTTADGTLLLPRLAARAGEEFVLQAVGDGWFLEQTCTVGADGNVDLGQVSAGKAPILRGTCARGPGVHLQVETHAGRTRSQLVTADRRGQFVVTDLVLGPCVVAPLFAKRAALVEVTDGDNAVELP